MSRFDSFPGNARAAVLGASGGIGSAMTRLLAESGRFETVYALSRGGVDPGHARTRPLSFDYSSRSSLETAAADIGESGALDFVFVATGVLHDGSAVRPEKSMSEIDADSLARVFHVNAIGPAVAASFLLPLMRARSRNVFAALSARVGSIDDNRLGGWVAYRSSKAALNMILRTLSIEQARRNPESVVVALHPGTVATQLSGPFTRRMPDNRLFTPDRAAAQLADVIDGLGADDTGGFFAWDGKPVPW